MIARRLLFSFLLLTVVLLASSCKTTRQKGGVETSGFLGDYSQLREGKGSEAQLVYISEDFDVLKYDKILIESVQVWYAEDSQLDKVSADDLEMLTMTLCQAMIDELSKDYTIVDKPGPGVLVIRAAITESRGSKVAFDLLTTAIPQTRLLSTVGQLTTDANALTGTASVEMEAVDGESNTRVFAAVDRRAGTKALRGSTSKWSDVRDAYRYWAERLRKRLAEEREKAGAPESKE